MSRSIKARVTDSLIGFLRANPLTQRISRAIVRGRDVTMLAGIGAGLKFNSGKSNPAYALGTNERPVQMALAQHLSAGDVFFDIGANVGFFSVIGAKLVGSTGQVFAFEPVPQNAGAIRRNVKLNHFQNVTLIEKAVSNMAGSGTLLVTDYSGGATLSTVGTPPDVSETLVVDLVSIDELIVEKVLPPPSVVKIDVEGAEVDVLNGMTQTLKELRPIVIFEVDDADESVLWQKYELCHALLVAANYEVILLESSYIGSEWHVQNAIATPKAPPRISR
jgi:FkbM family methyltransferase